ncbi:MAG TPA: quinolinate synthase NadA [Thermomicrobiales bacterium]|nr:quinolinate synthase NadA [Thermomicrobiales bacterium]
MVSTLPDQSTTETNSGQAIPFGQSLTSWFIEPQLNPASCVPEETVGAYPTLKAYGAQPLRQQKIDKTYFKMDTDERVARIRDLRAQLGERMVVLGHHYQRDDVIQFADFRGDSYKLSQQAATRRDAEVILFCGVHFMAETADILSGAEQKVILPNLEAGCSMADMANIRDVESCWSALGSLGIDGVVPVTYMNSTAALKAFCGRNGGIVCTSSNASRVFDWSFERGERILFFPDEHLGRNTGNVKGIPAERMIVWDPFLPMGGNSEEAIKNAQLILWKGYCSVHARFTTEQIAQARTAFPDLQVIVHPECRAEVVNASDFNGSTERIIDVITGAPEGTSWAVGTEINLVNRLQKQMPGKTIFCLDPVICPCSTMYRVHPAYLLWTMEHLVAGDIVNQITVDGDTRNDAMVALNRMLAVP